MEVYKQEATCVEWCDDSESSDVLIFSFVVEVPNLGEALLDVHYYGYSMEHSGIWMFLEDGAGAYTDLICREDDPGTCNDSGACEYDSTEISYRPYDCDDHDQGDWIHTWEGVDQSDAGSEVGRFRLHSLMDDGNGTLGDSPQLYYLRLWIRRRDQVKVSATLGISMLALALAALLVSPALAQDIDLTPEGGEDYTDDPDYGFKGYKLTAQQELVTCGASWRLSLPKGCRSGGMGRPSQRVPPGRVPCLPPGREAIRRW